MWLAQQQKREVQETVGSVGTVTISGNTPAVELDSERRGLTVYAPGGYRWSPPQGQKVLVLKADGNPCVIGVPLEGGLAPGEIVLESEGGAAVRLKNTKDVILENNVRVAGQLYVGGIELQTLIESIVIQVLAGKGG